MTDAIALDGPSFFHKIEKVHQTWQKNPQRYDAFLAVQGKVNDDDLMRPETAEFIMWLLHWEFSDTIVLLLKTKIIFGVSPKKAQLLSAMKTPSDYNGPSLEVMSRTKGEDVAAFVSRVMAQVPSDIQKVAVFQKDKEDGDLSQKVLSTLKTRGVTMLEMSDFVQEMQKVKIDDELKNMGIAAKLTDWTFKRVIAEIEDIIEMDKQVKHSYIQSKIESGLESETTINTFLDSHPGVKSSFLEYPLPIQIQSGNGLSVNKFEVDSSDEKLSYKSIYINVCSKAYEMSAMASRTLLVDPSDEHKNAYNIATDALDTLITQLKAGQPINSAYTAAKNLVMQRNANLTVSANFGFGIGFNYKERVLVVNATNETIVQPGMTFHVRISLSGIGKDQARSIMAVGDTIVISESGANKVLTAGIQKKYNDISYMLEESDNEQKEEVKEKKSPAKKPQQPAQKKAQSSEEGSYEDDDDDGSDEDEGSQEIMKAGQNLDFQRTSRLRSKAVDQQDRVNEAEDRKINQMKLHKLKQRDLKIRYDRGEIQCTKAKKKIKDMKTLQAYRSAKEYPKDLVPGKIYVDAKRYAVLIPNSQTTWIPVHIGAIKSVSDTVQGQWTFLRINFHTSGGNTMAFPPMEDPSNLWMKALTMKTQSTGQNNRLAQASKQIKDCMKQLKALDQERDVKAANAGQAKVEELQMLKNSQKQVLDNLVIRPNLVGRKTIGSLEIHQNGVRFQSNKGQKVDITFSNVKHLFYQPCASDELIVILHFHLKQPILIGDKPAQDVQFYKESGIAAEDINFKGGRHKMNEMDELEQEEAERQQRVRLNKRFLNFAENMEQASMRCQNPLEVDIPQDELTFTGCPMKQVVKIRPTKNCLVALSEFPFFVLDVNDIEVVHFERMYYGMKNFDLAVIMKDFITCIRINSIPTEFTDQLKSYFNMIGIIYLESMAPLKWDLILQQIREDFPAWLEESGWMQLVEDDEEGEGEESEDEEDPACDYGEEEDESEESDYSDGISDEESSDGEDESLSEEGEDWDELEKKAIEEDRKQGMPRQSAAASRKQPPPSNRRRR